MKKQNNAWLLKFSIALLFVFIVFSSANAAVCEKRYYPNATEIPCSAQLPVVTYSQVVPMSLPLHFTFGILDSMDIYSKLPSNLKSLACGSSLYSLTINGLKMSSIECTPDATYETHNITRYNYKWDIAFDAVVIVSDNTAPVPVLVGRDLKLTGQTPTALETLCKGNSLCYTQLPR